MAVKNAVLIGLGAMGAFFAPRMEAYLGRGNFQVIARGERKVRLENQGVTINGVTHRFSVRTPEEEGKAADLIIMAVKDGGLKQAICDIKNCVGEHTQILCVMNGVESEEQVAEVYGWDHVLYSYMRVSIVMKDQKADFDPDWGKVHFGEKTNEQLSERVREIRDFFEACHIPWRIEKDMIHGLWYKFMCNVGENLTCALLGIPFGAFRTSQGANAIRMAAMREVKAVGECRGVFLTEEEMENQYKTLVRIPYQNKPSTLQDLEGGKKTEVEMFAGTVVRLGEQYQIPVPVCRMFLDSIHVLEEKNLGEFDQTEEI